MHKLSTDQPVDHIRQDGNAAFFGGPRHGHTDTVIDYSFDTTSVPEMEQSFPAEVFFQAPIPLDGMGSWATSPSITYKLWRRNSHRAVYVFEGWLEQMRSHAGFGFGPGKRSIERGEQ